MARAKGLHTHPIKEGVFSFITKGFATDVQIFGKTENKYIKAVRIEDYMTLDADVIPVGVYLVLENTDIFGIMPTYQVTEVNDKSETIKYYNIYKQG